LLICERALEESVELQHKENQLIGFNAETKIVPPLQSSCRRSPEANPSVPPDLFSHPHLLVLRYQHDRRPQTPNHARRSMKTPPGSLAPSLRAPADVVRIT
jgi:hypothetical protein